MKLFDLRLGHVGVSAKLCFVEDGDIQSAHGGKGSVINEPGYAGYSVVAAERQAGIALVTDGALLQHRGDDLVFQPLVILAIAVGFAARILNRDAGEVGVGRGVGKLNLLLRRQADLAVQRNFVLLKLVSGGDYGLLLLLILDASAQFDQVGDGPGHVFLMRLVEESSVGVQKRFRVVQLGGGGNDFQVGGSDVKYDQPERGFFVIVGGAFVGFGGAPSVPTRPGEERLREVDLPDT